MRIGTIASPLLAWFMVIVGGLMWILGAFQLVFGGAGRLSGLALVVLMSWSITVGVLSLINQRRRRRGLGNRL